MNDFKCKEYVDNLTLNAMNDNFTFQSMMYFQNPEIWKEPDLTGYVKLFAYALIIIGGVLGNISVILIVTLYKKMRSTINIYIANLAVADALISVICMIPHALSVLTMDIFVFGPFMCKFNPFTQMTCLTSSVLTLSAIACDRFIAVMFPLRKRVMKQYTSVVIPIIWIISIAVAVPFLLVKKHVVIEWKNFVEEKCMDDWPYTFYYDPLTGECINHQPLKVIYHVVASVSLFFLPILIMVTAYSLIIWKLWHSEIPGEQQESNVVAHCKTMKKVIKMGFSVLIAFIFCWTPVTVTVLHSVLGEESPDWYDEFNWFSYYIAYANSFINPIIYGVFNENFREGFCVLVRCGFRRDASGRLARWRSTLTSVFTLNSSRISKSRNSINKSQNLILETKCVQPLTNQNRNLNVKETRGTTETKAVFKPSDMYI